MQPMRPAAALAGSGVASDYAEALLAFLGVCVARRPGPADADPAALWAASGAMALTGHADGPPRLAPGPLAACAVGALRALAALAPEAPLPRDAAALLGERAACSGATRRGRISPGGSCRLLRCADGWIALNLAREADVRALPAWLEAPPRPDESAWQHVARLLPARQGAGLARRAAWLGLPMAVAGPPPARAPEWLRVEKCGAPRARAPGERPRVLDLSGLWAGPLAASLLAACGARVWKLESRARPDGARGGPRRFFDLLNAGKASLALDLDRGPGRDRLRGLIARADIVIESARPRALSQLGIDAEVELARRPGLTWLGLTGYGRRDPAPGRVAFGDDAAVAAGLAEATGRDEGAPLFCGDAIADPLAGLHGALAALASWRAGGGRLLDLSLRDVVAHALHFAPDAGDAAQVEPDGEGGHRVCGEGFRVAVASPRARTPAAVARRLGADTARVLHAQGLPC
jgi:crotonobetainyl-CoA:carnitine CoA-transferase CaiB-like acyl-CoA transferase